MLTVDCSAVKKTPDNNENTKRRIKGGVEEYKGKASSCLDLKKGQFCEGRILKENIIRLLFLNSLGQIKKKNSTPSSPQ